MFLPVAEDTQVEPPLELLHFPARECLVAKNFSLYFNTPEQVDESELRTWVCVPRG